MWKSKFITFSSKSLYTSHSLLGHGEYDRFCKEDIADILVQP